MACHMVWYIQYLGSMWSDGLGQNRDNDEEYDKDCVKEGFSCLGQN